MKFKSFALSILAVLALMVGSAFSQNGAFAPYVDAGIGGSSTFTGAANVTAHNPNYIVGAGIESSTKHLLLNLDARFESANYRTFGLANGDNYAATVTGTGFVKVGHLLLGGGTLYRDNVIGGNVRSLLPNLQSTTFVPLVGGGVQFSRDRFTAVYELPGRSGVNQRTVDFNNEFFLTKSAKLRLTQQVSINTSDTGVPSIGSVRVSGGSANVGVKFVF